jgi:hypothetical protein
MSGYAGAGQATLLRGNQQVFLFQQELIPAGRASRAVQLERISRPYYPWGVSFQLFFTDVNGLPADPGAFEIDIQTSDLDQDRQYATINSWTGAVSLTTSFVGRIELPNFYAKYVRAFVNSLANAAYVTLLATR